MKMAIFFSELQFKYKNIDVIKKSYTVLFNERQLAS